jgi:hypothetical protein
LDAYYGIKYNQRDLNDFPRKIRELATRHHQHIKVWEPDIEALVEKVKATRHFYTHYNPKWDASGKVLRGAELIKLNTVLRMIFQMCVSTECVCKCLHELQNIHHEPTSTVLENR